MDISEEIVNPPPWRGWLVVLGGFLIHLTLGIPYSLGNLIPYLASYFRVHVSPNTNSHDLVWIFGSVTIGHGIFMTLGGILEHKLTAKGVVIIGCLSATAGLAFSSLSINHSVGLLVLTQGLALGIAIAFAYVPPISMAMQWFPERKGLVSGCITAGLGFGAFFFTHIQTFYINPDNISVNATTGYFDDPQLLGRLPSMYLILAATAAGLQITGWLLLTPRPIAKLPVQKAEEGNMLAMKETNGVASHTEVTESLLNGHNNPSGNGHATAPAPKLYLTPKEALHTREFYLLWGTMFCNLCFVVYISSVYKAFGQTFISDDQFLAMVGSVAAVFNSLGRIGWGLIADKFSYKVLMGTMAAIMTVLLCTWNLTSSMQRAGFAVWVWMLYTDESGHFSLLPTCIAQTFGTKHMGTIYGLASTSLIISGPSVSLLTQYLHPLIGWAGMAFVMAAFSGTTGFLTLLFRGSHIKRE